MIDPGSRVRVLPGRQFPAFSTGDAGVAVRVDLEARTCDVLFDGREGGPVPVAMRHLTAEKVSAPQAATGRQSGVREPPASQTQECPWERRGSLSQSPMRKLFDRGAYDEASSAMELAQETSQATGVSQLESPNPSAQLRQLDAVSTPAPARRNRSRGAEVPEDTSRSRAAGPQSDSASCVSEALPAGRSRDDAARLSALEARVTACEAISCGSQAIVQEGQQVEDAERAVGSMREAAQALRQSLDRITGQLEAHERRCGLLNESAVAAESSLTRSERRAADLELAASGCEASIGRLGVDVEAQAGRLADLEGRAAALQVTAPAAGDARESDELLWKAFRELQELVVRESEHRAAGLREVMGVVGQSVEQLRTEQARHASEMEQVAHSEQKRSKQEQKQHSVELESRHAEHDNRLDSFQARFLALAEATDAERRGQVEARHEEHEQRLESLQTCFSGLAEAMDAERRSRAEAISSVERKVREAHGHPAAEMVSAAAASAGARKQSPSPSPRLVSSDSLRTLEALEARVDCQTRPSSSHAREASPSRAKAENTLGRLKGHLESLKCELASSAASGAGCGLAVSSPSVREPAAEPAAENAGDSAESSTVALPFGAEAPATSPSAVAPAMCCIHRQVTTVSSPRVLLRSCSQPPAHRPPAMMAAGPPLGPALLSQAIASYDNSAHTPDVVLVSSPQLMTPQPQPQFASLLQQQHHQLHQQPPQYWQQPTFLEQRERRTQEQEQWHQWPQHQPEQQQLQHQLEQQLQEQQLQEQLKMQFQLQQQIRQHQQLQQNPHQQHQQQQAPEMQQLQQAQQFQQLQQPQPAQQPQQMQQRPRPEPLQHWEGQESRELRELSAAPSFGSSREEPRAFAPQPSRSVYHAIGPGGGCYSERPPIPLASAYVDGHAPSGAAIAAIAAIEAVGPPSAGPPAPMPQTCHLAPVQAADGSRRFAEPSAYQTPSLGRSPSDDSLRGLSVPQSSSFLGSFPPSATYAITAPTVFGPEPCRLSAPSLIDEGAPVHEWASRIEHMALSASPSYVAQSLEPSPLQDAVSVDAAAHPVSFAPSPDAHGRPQT